MIPLVVMALVVGGIGVVALLERAGRTDGVLAEATRLSIVAPSTPRTIRLALSADVRGLAAEATAVSLPLRGFAGVGCWTGEGIGYVLGLRADGATGIVRIDPAGTLTPLTALRAAEAFRAGEPQRLRLECVPGADVAAGTLAIGYVNDVPAVTLAIPGGGGSFTGAGVSAWQAPADSTVEMEDVVATRHRADSGPPPMIESPAIPPPSWAPTP